MKRHSEKGMALVITLMMLAIVTFMAVVFLSLSRRERANVKTLEDQATARMMANDALERAKADMTAHMVNVVENDLASYSPAYGATNVQRQIAVANRRVQNGLLHYDLRTSRNFSNPAGFRRSERNNPWNVSFDVFGNPIDNKGNILASNSDDYYQQVANLQYDPRPPVIVTEGKTNDNRFYVDLNRNGMFDASGVFDATGPNNEHYTLNKAGAVIVANAKPYLQSEFVGDPEWIGVLERPDLPHSETNRFVGRYAYLMLPTGKSLDINFIHNLALFTGTSTNLSYGGNGPNATPRFSRNQGVGPWELNMAGFLVDLHTNVWRPPSFGTSSFYKYSTNEASGKAFQDAVGLLQFRLNNSRANLMTPQQVFGAGQNFIWANDNVDMAGDGPIVPYSKSVGRTFLVDNDSGARYWHGLEQADKTGEYADVQRYFKLSTPTSTSEQLDFYTKFVNAVASSRTNTYDRYAYYRMLAQLGADSKPALQGKIHLNYTNEPGSISTNFVSWVSNNLPTTMIRPLDSVAWNVTSNRVALPSDPDYQVQIQTRPNRLTNFFLMAADAMLKADLVTNVFLDRLGLQYNSKIDLQTNYTVGGSYFDDPSENAIDPHRTEGNITTARVIVNTPVRPDISVTNIQIFHVPNTNSALWAYTDLTYTNAEYLPEVHRILQLAANIYDNMTNNPGRRSQHRPDDPFFPTVWRPIYAMTSTNITIVGWEPQDTAAFANTHTTNMVSPRDYFFANRPGPGASPLLLTNVNFYGQPWVIGAKKGWPNFNEFSIETFVDVTRKLEIIKQGTLKAGDKIDLTDYDTLARHTAQIFLIGLSNKFGLEAWNSYAVANHRTIRIDAEVDASFGIDRITQRDASTNPTAWFPVFTSPNVIRMLGGFTVPAAPGWPGRQSDMDLAKAMATPGSPAIANGPSDFRVPIYTNAAVFPAVGNLDPYAGHEYSDATGFFVTPAQWMSISNTPDLRLNITNRIRYLAVDTAENKVIDYVTLDNLVTSIDLTKALRGNPATASQTASGVGESLVDAPWNSAPLDGKNLGLTRGIMQQITNSLSDLPPPGANIWRSFNTSDSLDKQIKDFQDYIKGVNTNSTIATNIARQVPYSPTRTVYIQSLYQANDPFVHYLASDLRDAEISPRIQTVTSGNPVKNPELGKRNFKRQAKHLDGSHGPWFQDPGVTESDDWQFPIAKLDNNVGSSSRYGITNFQYRFPNIGALGQIHRGTPWQTVYLKAAAALNAPGNKIPQGALTNYPTWINWAGSFGTHPTNDWKLVGLFTTAITENAARGLLSVNQTNTAAWSAVLSGVPVITNSLSDTQSKINQKTQFGVPPPVGNYEDLMIEPGSPQLLKIVKNINDYRVNSGMGKFYYLGQILGTPMLSIGTSLLDSRRLQYSPYLNLSDAQIRDTKGQAYNWHGVTDEALEAIPARILSLLKEDEPRVTIYCFGQTLRPAPRSYITSSDFYNLCVNYQVTGEYVTKAVVRVEGEMKNSNNPLRTVVESFDVLAPFE